jgi:hypothetical protein
MPVFDVEGFCDQVMAVGRPCDGDDEIMEGNQIGLCSTTLRQARDGGASLNVEAGAKCLGDVKSAQAGATPLPDIRTLDLLAQRFESCRRFGSEVPALAKVVAVPAGSAKAGEPCRNMSDCAHGLFCPQPTPEQKQPTCASKKAGGESCRRSAECIGRCSRRASNTCVAYCGRGG